MSKLTDLEICQRIAEIEGRAISGVGSLNVFVKCEPSLIGNEQYDPLTDDALCFKLMVKYKIILSYHPKGYKAATDIFNFLFDKNPSKAICLAIIESKEPKT
jgi:hypothetical protein